jgi:hypothetical protein
MSAAAVVIFSLQDSTLHCASGIQNPTARQWETQQVQTSYFRIPKFTAQLNTLLPSFLVFIGFYQFFGFKNW